MATDNVTPIRAPWDECDRLDRRIGEALEEIPGSDMGIGYELSAETRQELEEAIPHLREALRLLQRAREREAPRYEACAERHGS